MENLNLLFGAKVKALVEARSIKTIVMIGYITQDNELVLCIPALLHKVFSAYPEVKTFVCFNETDFDEKIQDYTNIQQYLITNK